MAPWRGEVMLAWVWVEAVELEGEDLGCVLESNARTCGCLGVVRGERKERVEEAPRLQA